MQAATGLAEIEAIRSARPDLVLCDVAMPGMDRYAVLEAVRADPRIASTPFLFVTGLDPRHHFRAAMSLGADDYVAKPVRQDDLVAGGAPGAARGGSACDATLPVAGAYVRKIVSELDLRSGPGEGTTASATWPAGYPSG